MTKSEIANNLVKLHSEYQEVASKYGWSVTAEYSEAVAQAILLLSQTKEEGAE